MLEKLRSKYTSLPEIHRRIFSGAFWSLFGTSVSKVIVLCATIIVARILSKSEYGELGMIRSTISMFMAFSGFSIGATASKYIAENRNGNKEFAARIYMLALLFSMVMAIVFGSIVLFASDYIATNSFAAPYLSDVVKMSAIILIFATLSGSQSGVLSGFEDFKTISRANMLFGLAESVFIVLGAMLGGVEGVIIGFGLANLVNFIYLHYFASRHIRKLGYSTKELLSKIKLKDLSVLYAFSLPATISSILVMICVWYSKTYLVQVSGFEAMATFDIAEQWRTQLLFIPAAISQIVLPILSNSKQSNNQPQVVKINLAINLSVTVAILLLLMVFGKYIMSMYGDGYTNTLPLCLMAVTGVIISMTNILGSLCFANDKAWHICFLNGLQGGILILCTKYFVDRGFAETGLAYANVVSYVAFLIVLGAVSYCILKRNK